MGVISIDVYLELVVMLAHCFDFWLVDGFRVFEDSVELVDLGTMPREHIGDCFVVDADVGVHIGRRVYFLFFYLVLLKLFFTAVRVSFCKVIHFF